MSTSKYVALTDLYVSAGTRAFYAGQEVDQDNEYFADWKEQGLVATAASKKAQEVVVDKE